MASRVAVVRFPGTNCEFDVVEALTGLGGEAEIVFHDVTDLSGFDGVVIAGGFAHGDYLRTGAIARFSPIMGEVERLAREGAPVVGICNGFQVLCEAGLLPGALQKNSGLKFLCGMAGLRIETTDSALTSECTVGEVREIPINHFTGNYTCDDETLAMLRAEERIVVRYTENPNGSVDDIAGVCSEGRNVVGLMPHPERACHDLLGSTDGRQMMASILSWK